MSLPAKEFPLFYPAARRARSVFFARQDIFGYRKRLLLCPPAFPQWITSAKESPKVIAMKVGLREKERERGKKVSHFPKDAKFAFPCKMTNAEKEAANVSLISTHFGKHERKGKRYRSTFKIPISRYLLTERKRKKYREKSDTVPIEMSVWACDRDWATSAALNSSQVILLFSFLHFAVALRCPDFLCVVFSLPVS